MSTPTQPWGTPPPDAEQPPAPGWQPPPTPPQAARKPSRWRTPATAFLALLLGLLIGNSGDPAPADPRPARTVTATETVTEAAEVVTETVTETVTEAVAAAPAPEPAPAPAPAAQTEFTDGQYIVGTELPTGIYRTTGDSRLDMGCYVAQYDSPGGEVVDNDIGQGPRTFNFATPGTMAEFSGGCTWTRQP